jgi:hypothetical protein
VLGLAVVVGFAVRVAVQRLQGEPPRVNEGWLRVPPNRVLPPAPDPAENKATLLGVDRNTNGVRDDVEIYIGQTWGLATERGEALRLAAGSVQQAIALGGLVYNARSEGRPPPIQDEDIIRVRNQTAFAGACVLKTFGSDYGEAGRAEGDAALRAVVERVLDTQERRLAYANAVPPPDAPGLPDLGAMFVLNPCDGLLRFMKPEGR